jgi:hypothetical protein
MRVFVFVFHIEEDVNICKDGSLIVVCSVWRQISEILPISKGGWENSLLWKQLISTQTNISSETHNQMLLTLYQLCKHKGGKWRPMHQANIDSPRHYIAKLNGGPMQWCTVRIHATIKHCWLLSHGQQPSIVVDSPLEHHICKVMDFRDQRTLKLSWNQFDFINRY